ncbi:hypothetical protein [Xanthocytophaga flava]|uniref:hypothetical protein n=1 Tax=Xanthocytophaga flava TaxID=3048013 RepID=UPI0028D3EDCF|nr:hypothetical protein [Xanthocytophaga flavus]MDJ1468689.1 hypothetical protein [Xanthocytophaga flavus]
MKSINILFFCLFLSCSSRQKEKSADTAQQTQVVKEDTSLVKFDSIRYSIEVPEKNDISLAKPSSGVKLLGNIKKLNKFCFLTVSNGSSRDIVIPGRDSTIALDVVKYHTPKAIHRYDPYESIMIEYHYGVEFKKVKPGMSSKFYLCYYAEDVDTLQFSFSYFIDNKSKNSPAEQQNNTPRISPERYVTIYCVLNKKGQMSIFKSVVRKM